MDTSESIVSATDQRLEQAEKWLQSLDLELQSEFLAIAGDASFRRYFMDRLFDVVTPKYFYGIQGDAADLEDELIRYSALLKQFQKLAAFRSEEHTSELQSH